MASNETRQGREKLTLIRVFEALRGPGYEAAYDAVRHYARIWQRNQAATSIDALVPLNPDEAYQFDWSHEFVLINGRAGTVKVKHARLGLMEILPHRGICPIDIA
jgi:hypothetical protein